MRLGRGRNDFIFNYICDKQWVGVLLLGTYLLGLHGEVAWLGRIFLPQVPVHLRTAPGVLQQPDLPILVAHEHDGVPILRPVS